MTLRELSVQYAGSAEAIHRRIVELRKEEAALQDPEALFHIRRRIQELTPLWREARELARLTEHYYDRSFCAYAYYKI